jgi:hypothetical protein
MSTIANLILAQQYITRYVLSTVLALGTLGNIIAIIIFSQKKQRRNSCSIYLIAMSIFGLIAANWAIAPLVNALSHFDLVNGSLVFCRIRGYIVHVSTMCFRYTLMLMCADRFALCNHRARIRAFCQPKIAYRSVGVLTLFWSIVSIHLLILESIENNRCSVYGLYGQIFSVYVLIFSSIIPVIIMISFGVLIMRELRQLNSRIQPFGAPRRLNRHNIILVKLVLVEIVVYILLNIANPLTLIYTNTTSNMGLIKSAERRQIESFISFVALSVLLYLNYNTTFYVQFMTSKTYRMEVKRLLWKLMRKEEEGDRSTTHQRRIISNLRSENSLRTTKV